MGVGTIMIAAALGAAFRIRVDDEELSRLRAGEQAAFHGLVRKHHGSLVRIARTIVHSREAAEDVAQETWIAVYRGLGDFDGRSAFSTWLFTILINKARTRARADKRYVAMADEDTSFEAEPLVPAGRFAADGHWADPPARLDMLDPERILSGRETWRQVSDIVERLPPAQRAVLLMRDVEGREAAETCQLLALSPDNQRALLHRARSRIREELEKLVVASGPNAITRS